MSYESEGFVGDENPAKGQGILSVLQTDVSTLHKTVFGIQQAIGNYLLKKQINEVKSA